MSRKHSLVGLLAALTLIAALFGTAGAEVTPASVDADLGPGESVDVVKQVTVPEAPPRADVYFLADTTGSMGSVISQVKADSATILAGIGAEIADVQFGAGQYKDFPYDPFAFEAQAPIGPDDGVGGSPDASDAIASWFAAGGGDGPEGQLFALDQIADAGDPAGLGWRPDATRIVVWFGDAPGHDPVCSAISGLPYDIDEASATAKLEAAGIAVVAISTLTGYPDGLDDDPLGFDYVSACGEPGGTAGQASRIAGATGGVHVEDVPASEIVDAIVGAIGSITFDVTAEPVDCGPLEVTFDPASHEDVAGGTTVTFDEQIALPGDVAAADLPADGVVTCTVEFKASGSIIGVQSITVNVPPVDVGTPVDVKPGSCPNPMQTTGRGVVPVAILGTDSFDVRDIDPTTATLAGVAPLRWSIEDVATPHVLPDGDVDRFDCTTAQADGVDDLTLKFNKAEFRAALGPIAVGDVIVVEVVGELFDGTPFSGADVIWVNR